jgi:hypothetical protein
MTRRLISRLALVAIFSIAFAYIEAAVVVYLRQIFHPNGFVFPLTAFGAENFNKTIFLTELGREAATLALIFTAAVLFGRNRQQRAAYFMIIFALWDIFYYVWLKVLINWPASLMDWDILFLIPLTWASPVLAPILVSVVLILFALVILWLDARNSSIKPGLIGWGIFAGAALLLVAVFCSAGRFAGQADYRAHFSWLAFAAALPGPVCLFAGYTLTMLLRNSAAKSIC